MRTLILASASPQRRDLLTHAGIPFRVVVSRFQERERGVGGERLATANARGKALDVALAHPGAVVLGADTTVAIEGESLGAPEDRDAATRMLEALSGRAHDVTTALCLVADGATRVRTATTNVRFRTLDADTIRWYVRRDEWRGRAGGYAIQCCGSALVAAVEGDYTNVVGLPVPLLVEMLEDAGMRGIFGGSPT
ncbi:MAG: septum formation protein Maf [Actinobacteria bacterium]|nr:septum formation protein Maf [Actinomycetota bacterium]